MTNCDEAARGPDEQRLVDVASILAAGILRLRDRQSLPVPKQLKNPSDSSPERWVSGHILRVSGGPKKVRLVPAAE